MVRHDVIEIRNKSGKKLAGAFHTHREHTMPAVISEHLLLGLKCTKNSSVCALIVASLNTTQSHKHYFFSPVSHLRTAGCNLTM
jgi:hypothetical protein